MTDDLDQWVMILNEPELIPERDISEFNIPAQTGPLRYFDTPMRCVSDATARNAKNCGSSTHYKLKGMPTCVMHCLIEMNRILADA